MNIIEYHKRHAPDEAAFEVALELEYLLTDDPETKRVLLAALREVWDAAKR